VANILGTSHFLVLVEAKITQTFAITKKLLPDKSLGITLASECFSSRILSKDVVIQITKTIILSHVCLGP
jgi:hypothetical protein